MTLRLEDLKKHGRTVLRLISIGALVTWALATLAAHLILGFGFELALLLGAILIVSGPTVVLPLLRHINPRGRDRSDPHLGGHRHRSGRGPCWPCSCTRACCRRRLGTGHRLRALGADQDGGHRRRGRPRRRVDPRADAAPLLDSRPLHNPVTLALVIGVFAGTNVAQHECGLLAVTVMGIVRGEPALRLRAAHPGVQGEPAGAPAVLASSSCSPRASRQPRAWRRLAAWTSACSRSSPCSSSWSARPPCWASTRGSHLTHEERLFLAWLCPRGIVAAAVASVFGFELDREPGTRRGRPAHARHVRGHRGYGRGVRPDVGHPSPDASGSPYPIRRASSSSAPRVGTRLASALPRRGHRGAPGRIRTARSRRPVWSGLPARHGTALEEHVGEALDLGGVGRVAGAHPPTTGSTPLVALHFLHPSSRRRARTSSPRRHVGRARLRAPFGPGRRLLFAADADYSALGEPLPPGVGSAHPGSRTSSATRLSSRRTAISPCRCSRSLRAAP